MRGGKRKYLEECKLGKRSGRERWVGKKWKGHFTNLLIGRIVKRRLGSCSCVSIEVKRRGGGEITGVIATELMR